MPKRRIPQPTQTNRQFAVKPPFSQADGFPPPLTEESIAIDERFLSSPFAHLKFSKPEQLADRLFSSETRTRLEEARQLGIPPQQIIWLCLERAPKRWNEKSLTIKEARAAAKTARRTAKWLNDLMPRLVLHRPIIMRDPVTGKNRPVILQGERAPADSSLREAPLSPPTWERLAQVAENDLEDLATVLERLAAPGPDGEPSKLFYPGGTHRPFRLNERAFALDWDYLARHTAGKPCMNLGAYFLAITFDSKTYNAEQFKKLVARAKAATRSTSRSR